jgi:hypothetical protein
MEYIIVAIIVGVIGYMWVSKNKPEWLKKLKK